MKNGKLGIPTPLVLLFVGFGVVQPIFTEAAAIPGLFNTGVDSNGQVLPVGSTDPHYSLTGPISGAKVTSRFVDGGNQWLTPPAGSAWIGPFSGAQTAPVGTYIYTLQLDLTGFDTSTTAVSGGLASDNNARILLNGSDIGFSNTGGQYTMLHPFTVSGFVPGINTLQFSVANNSSSGLNPTGLLVANLTVVPEPSTWALLATGTFLGLLIRRLRK